MAHKRDLQLANLIKKNLGDYCLFEPEMQAITICDVTMRDKKCAVILYQPSQPLQKYDDLLALQKKLEQHAPRIRHHLAKNVALKYTPSIVFTPTLSPQDL
jgi:ribosome-binding factor A